LRDFEFSSLAEIASHEFPTWIGEVMKIHREGG
jgi:hypothetical protein